MLRPLGFVKAKANRRRHHNRAGDYAEGPGLASEPLGTDPGEDVHEYKQQLDGTRKACEYKSSGRWR